MLLALVGLVATGAGLVWQYQQWGLLGFGVGCLVAGIFIDVRE